MLIIIIFTFLQETLEFIQDFYPEWTVEADRVTFTTPKAAKSEVIPSLKLISQNLAYATELERIV